METEKKMVQDGERKRDYSSDRGDRGDRDRDRGMDRGDKRPGGGFSFKKRRRRRKKICQFTARGFTPDYKDINTLKKYVHPTTGKILSRRNTGTSARYQRVLKKAIKRARNLSLLPYTLI